MINIMAKSLLKTARIYFRCLGNSEAKCMTVAKHIVYQTSISLVVVFSCYANCETTIKISPDNQHKIVSECNNMSCDNHVYSRNCRVFAISVSGKIEWIHKETDLPEPNVKWHDNNLAEIKIPCGSSCNYSYFYDVGKGVSVPYEFVIAVNTDKLLIARAGKSNIIVNQIFGNHKQIIKKIHRDYAETAVLFW